jgi:pimeloyl-ACP methyl ester carboxylesterase
LTIPNAAHFLQEDNPEEIADLLHRFIGRRA